MSKFKVGDEVVRVSDKLGIGYDDYYPETFIVVRVVPNQYNNQDICFPEKGGGTYSSDLRKLTKLDKVLK